MESSEHDWTLSSTAISLQFFFSSPASATEKFSIHEFFRSDVL